MMYNCTIATNCITTTYHLYNDDARHSARRVVRLFPLGRHFGVLDAAHVTASENAVASSSAFSFLRSRLTATAIRPPSPLNARHAILAGYRVLCHSRFFLSPSHTHTYPSPPPVANARR